MDLKEIFEEVSNQMKSDFVKAQKSFTHSGLKGDAKGPLKNKLCKSIRRRHPIVPLSMELILADIELL